MKKLLAAGLVAATGAVTAPALADDAQLTQWRPADAAKVWQVHGPYGHRRGYHRRGYYYDDDYYYYKERKRAQNLAIARDFIGVFGAIAIEGIRNQRYRDRYYGKRRYRHRHFDD